MGGEEISVLYGGHCDERRAGNREEEFRASTAGGTGGHAMGVKRGPGVSPDARRALQGEGNAQCVRPKQVHAM